MSHIFHNFWSLKNIPGIENWDISNVSNMSFMFYNSPIDFNDIINWNISNFQKSDKLFSNFNNYYSENIINIIFRERSPFFLKSLIVLTIHSDMLIEDLIDKFWKKTYIIYNSNKVKFTYNDSFLNRNLSAIEAGLENNSNIFVKFR